MHPFEREIVATLVISSDRDLRAAVEDYVDGALRSMPEHLRAGVVAESVLLGAWARLRQAGGDHRSLADRLDAWEGSRIGPVRQYVRLLRSLVLFAEYELSPT